jgi:nucleoid-associated protein YgaU
LLDEKVVESITLGKDGNFAVLFDIELKDRPQVISLRSIDGEIILVSDETMIVAPKIVELAQADRSENQSVGADNSTDTASSQQETSQTTSDQNSTSDLSAKTASVEEIEKVDEIDTTSDNARVKDDLINQTPQLAQPTEEKIEKEVQKILTTEPSVAEIASSGAAKPTILLADNEGVKVVQGGVGPTVMTDVLFDTINYSKDGGVAVTGRGSPDSIVRFYLNNSPVTSTAVDQTGYWSADLSDVEAGVYTLRLDQLDQSGKVSSRIESPFKREDRNVLADQMKDIASPAKINVITVQPGNTLWAISRERYGRGILYVQVFDANKDKIRNPDLIYPGQIFDLPDDIRVN